MIKRRLINEDNLPPKLPVVYSDEIMHKIENIKDYNQFEKDGLSKMFSHVKGVENHISNRAIAFGYGINYKMKPGKTVLIHDFGVAYRLVNNADRTFVEIVWMDLNLEDFGLEVPPMMNENKQSKKHTKKIYRLNESQLRRIVMDVIQKVLSA